MYKVQNYFRSFTKAKCKCLIRRMSSKAPVITISPRECLHDEPVAIKVQGLLKNDTYTIASLVEDGKGVQFQSTAHYNSDAQGCIDVTTEASVGGRYIGVFPMGLFNHIVPRKLLHRFAYTDVTTPLKFKFSVMQKAVGPHVAVLGQEIFQDQILCSTEHVRYLHGPGVRRIPVRLNRVRAALHLPPGDGPFPGVIDMFGGAGGLMEHRAALLASRGFAALALAFCGYDDLPNDTTLGEVLDIEYFEEAVDYLLSREEVIKDGVGAIGVSKSCDIVLNMAHQIPAVVAGVVINGSSYSIACATKLKGGLVRPMLPFASERILVRDNGALENIGYTTQDIDDYSSSSVPVEEINADILWLVGLDDKNLQSGYHADAAMSRLTKLAPHRQHKFQVLKFPGAGHLIEPPYVPFCEQSYFTYFRAGVVWGGNSYDHCRAQEISWQRILTFLREKLIPRNLKSKL